MTSLAFFILSLLYVVNSEEPIKTFINDKVVRLTVTEKSDLIFFG